MKPAEKIYVAQQTAAQAVEAIVREYAECLSELARTQEAMEDMREGLTATQIQLKHTTSALDSALERISQLETYSVDTCETIPAPRSEES